MQGDTARGLHATDLACRRGERIVFAGLALAVTPSGGLLLTGPNGSGKSSLLRVLAGLLPAEDGTLTWNGSAIDDDIERHRKRVAYLGHLDAVKPALTVFENLRFWSRMYGRSPRTHALDALERFGIKHLETLPARFLSQGQRRRLALCRLLLMPTRLWLLDEPTVGLDSDARGALGREIDRHRAAGGIVIAASHQDLDMRDAHTLDLSANVASAQDDPIDPARSTPPQDAP